MNVGSREVFNSECIDFPYISNGLVAMWDGEWNVSVGVHDQNAQYPNEIVSNVP